jgi:hypothetical protein
MCDEPLEDLRWNWGEAYAIDHLADGRWLAQRRDDRRTLVADGPEELRGMIQADYAACPVPRGGCLPE